MTDKKYPFGSIVKRRRLALGLTQDQLAERVGVSSRWIQLLESGTQQPKITSFLCLAQGLRCDPAILISEFQESWTALAGTPTAKAPSGFGTAVRALRNAAGLSVQVLATKAGVDEDWLSQIEDGHERPNLEEVLALARAMDVDDETLVRTLAAS